MAEQLPQVLGAALSHDHAQRQQAVDWLDQAKAADLPQFMVVLADFLRNTAAPAESRQQAGLQLKNCLSSKDDHQHEVLQEQWRNIAVAHRQHIKQSALATLGTEGTAKSTTAQVIAEIAQAEIPHNFWPDVITTLLHRLGEGQPDEAKVAALEAVGYICETVDPDFLVKDANDILTAVIHHMRKDEPNTRVKQASITALINALEFTSKNFENQVERTAIMTCVCEATLSPDPEVKLTALQCLVRTMELYYEHMETYMQALFDISLAAIKTDPSDEVGEKVVLQGIEFWNTVCERELDIIDEIEQRGGDVLGAATAGIPVYKQYAKGAHLNLVPIVLNLLIQTIETEDEDDPDDWNPAKASALCLQLYANVCRDKILPIVMPFTEGNLRSPAWQNRDAAVLAFASVLNFDPPVEQEKKAALIDYVIQAIPPVVGLMKDPSVVVRDSVAWLLCQIMLETPEAVIPNTARDIPPEYLREVCSALHGALADQPRVAIQGCHALFRLAESMERLHPTDGSGQKTSPLTPYLPQLIQGLFTAASSAPDNTLRLATFEALNSLVKASPEDCYPTVVQSTTEVITRLEASMHQAAQVTTNEAMQALADMQTNFLSLLQACIDVLRPDDVKQISDQIMTIMLALVANSATGETSAVKEDVMLTVSKLIEPLGPDFIKYLDWVKPHVLAGLQNTAETQVCSTCVGVTGDLTRGLGEVLLPHCNDFMTYLLGAIASPDLDRDIKPMILSTFGDIGMAIGEKFAAYYPPTVQTLQGAARHCMANTAELQDYDEIDHFNELREGCLDGYTGILQGLSGPDPDAVNQAAVALFQDQVQFLVEFIGTIFQDSELSDANKRGALGILGDLCNAFGGNMAPLLPDEFCTYVVTQGRQSDDDTTRSVAEFANVKLMQAKGAAAGMR
jgi:importin subunit beta-1